MVKVVTNEFVQAITEAFHLLPEFWQTLISFFALVLLIVIYAVLIWKFYRFIAKKNILGLDLNKYNKSAHPFFAKFFAGLLYLLEYIIILPFFVFLWLMGFTIFLVLLTEGLEMGNLLLISATIVAAIRVTSYIRGFGQKLAQEISKLLPFTLLALAMTRIGFFSLERVVSQFAQLPLLLNQAGYYLFFIILLEVVLRLLDFFFSLLGLEEDVEEEEEE